MNTPIPNAGSKACRPPLCVLKFGSSVLEDESGYAAIALEIYRHVRDGEKVVAVISALAGQTVDRVRAQAVAPASNRPSRS